MTIKERREMKGLSQTELAEKIGVKQTTISQYESGSRTPNLFMAKKLADALDISLDDIFHSMTFHNEIIKNRGKKENVKYQPEDAGQRVLSGALQRVKAQ